MTPLESMLTSQVEAQRLEIARLTNENKILREKVDLLIRRAFGSSSEKVDADQLLLGLEGAEAKKPEASSDALAALEADETPKRPAKPRKKKGGITDEMLESLPQEEVILIPDEVKAEPDAYRLVDQVVTKQLNFRPGSFVCRLIIRKRFARIDSPQNPPIVAELPTMLERSKAGPGLLASILTSKYCDHLPLYRQEQIAKLRHGIELSRQDMSRWVELAADWLRPIYQNILGGMWGDGYAQVDETFIDYLKPGNGSTKQGCLWTIKRPGGDAAFHWDPSRGATVLTKIIPVDFSGVIQCDAFVSYPAFVKRHAQPITLAGCWAHVRRKFFEASQTGQYRADALLIVRLIANLYAIEAKLRNCGASATIRRVVRKAESHMILEHLGAVLRRWKLSSRHLPASQMGKAVNYTLSNWETLGVYLDNGSVEIDNNEVENAIRPTAVGKKNWLFIGGEEAGERSAIVFTVIEACRRRGINPMEYLSDVFKKMPTMSAADYPSLAPDEWAKHHKVNKPAIKSTAATKSSTQRRRCA